MKSSCRCYEHGCLYGRSPRAFENAFLRPWLRGYSDNVVICWHRGHPNSAVLHKENVQTTIFRLLLIFICYFFMPHWTSYSCNFNNKTYDMYMGEEGNRNTKRSTQTFENVSAVRPGVSFTDFEGICFTLGQITSNMCLICNSHSLMDEKSGWAF